MPATTVPLMRMHPLRITVLALVVLLSAYIQFSVVARTSIDGPVRSDAIKYVAYAWNLKHYQTFSHAPFWTEAPSANPAPDNLTLPGYPVFLSALLGTKVDQGFLDRVTNVQAALGVATCVITLLLALRLMPFGFAVTAGLLTATSPHLATISTYVLTEGLFTFLLTTALYLGARALVPGNNLRRVALAGAMLGLASMVRPQMQVFPWLLLGLSLVVPRCRAYRKKTAIYLACFLLVTMPWQLRNLGVEHAPGDPDLLVTSLYHGSFPGLMYEDDPRTAGYAYSHDPEAARHGASLPAVIAYIADNFQQHPLRYARWYLIGKPVSFLSWADPANAGDIYIFPAMTSPYRSESFFIRVHLLAYWIHWPLMLLALGAMFVAGWRPELLTAVPAQQTMMRFLALTLAYVLVMHMLGAPYPRYGIPFRPLVYLLAVAMLSAAWRGLGWQWLKIKSDKMRQWQTPK
jgi:4-amino-4-deoxy-L-arabinose transferase-like glycosyltransferase